MRWACGRQGDQGMGDVRCRHLYIGEQVQVHALEGDSPPPHRPGGASPLRDLAVVPRAVLRWALWRADGLGALQAVAFAAAAPSAARQGVRAAVHHHSVHAVGHGEGFQVALDGDGKRQLIDQVDRRAGNDGPTTEVLEAEY